MVKPEILRWARKTAGLTPEEAVKKLRLQATTSASAVERLAVLEAGESTPTRPMLVKMAKVYRRPLLTFYLSSPPRRGDRGQDFRTLPEGQSTTKDALLDFLIRDVHARQSMVRAVLEDEEEAELLPFIGSKRMSDGVPAVLSSLRNTLRISLSEFRAMPTPLEAFALLRRAAEKIGVFVLLMGDLGSHHTAIDVEVFRGFALADELAPFVVINDQDSKAAWSFTLLHELTHLWLGETGISGERAGLAIERFCNDVASEFLLPRDELESISLDDAADLRSTEYRISEFVKERNLSHSMVAFRLYREGVISQDLWRDLSRVFRDMWVQGRRDRRERSRAREGGPNFYVVRSHRVGMALLDLVRRMVAVGALTTSKAGMVLGVKAKQVQPLLEQSEGHGIRRPV
jgi:Zn-dependent peptidase ImmA (M78 family)/transcriptional regulator with XRE-family HTH domain